MAWTTDISKDELLGVGLYTASEAAMYVDVHPQQIMRWLHGTTSRQSVVEPQFRGHREVVSFLDMVQSMAIRDMRKRDIPLPRIRDAARYVRRRFPEIKYPFAHRHQTFIIETSKQIALLLPDYEHHLRVSGSEKGQYVHQDMLDEYLTSLEFDENGLAERFVPMKRGNVSVVLDPQVRAGQPRVEPTGYLVEALADAYQAEGSTKAAAWWYEVTEAEVEIAVQYHHTLGLGDPLHAKAS